MKDALQWLGAFSALMLTDIFWGFYIQKVNKGAAFHAAKWAVLLFLAGAAAVVGYVDNPILLIPSAAGAFVGTYIAVRLERYELKEKFFTWLAWHLPRRLTYWAAVRVMTHAGYVYPRTEIMTLTPAQCLRAWEENDDLHR